MSTSEEMDAVFSCNYKGDITPNNNADSQAIQIANDEMSPTELAPPPKTWKEHWFEHDQLLSLVHYDAHVAVYYDKDVSRSLTWPFSYMSKVWQYTKKVYGNFGRGPRLYAIYHLNKYSGGHPSTYLDASHDYRNLIDVGRGRPGSWQDDTGLNPDICTHEVAHIVEEASKGKKGSPAFTIWGDSKWGEIFIYDVYKALGRTAEAQRFYDQMMTNYDNFGIYILTSPGLALTLNPSPRAGEGL